MTMPRNKARVKNNFIVLSAELKLGKKTSPPAYAPIAIGASAGRPAPLRGGEGRV